MEKAIFSHIHRFQHTTYADIEGMLENGYEGITPLEETIASYLSVGETSSLKAPSLHLSPSISLKWQGICSSRSDCRFVAQYGNASGVPS